MIALFCGSRGWVDEDPIGLDLVKLAPDTIVVHGNAKGADRIADRLARGLGLHVAVVDPLWDVHDGKIAPIIRNVAMLRLKPNEVYAYTLGTSGTQNMIDSARRASIPTYVRRHE